MQDISDWEREEENRGSHDGVWVREPRSRRRGLVKFPRVYRRAGFECAEAGAEVLAARVGQVLGLPVPDVELVRLDQRVACLSWSFLEPGWELREGVDLLGAGQDDGRRITLSEIRSVLTRYLGSEQAEQQLINLVCFDILIGNPDRHWRNWGVLAPTQQELPYHMAPYYDNGSAFGSNLDPKRVAAYIGDPDARDQFDRGFRYEIALAGSQRPKIPDLLRELVQWQENLGGFGDRLQKLTHHTLSQILESIDPEAMSTDRKAFAYHLLLRRSAMIQRTVAKHAS